MTSARRLEGVRAYGRAADAFETVAWRPPTAARFDARAANDAAAPEPTLKELVADLPGWVTVVGGGVIAALMGALVGGALAI
ncbi:hypothetical protein [uncultured Brevundimonas sp.]|mgnify:FL=1|uniref:hypothetical protein n=1 Tax=uncultured Brevundimonas sp. TaxID=213418 RepID=UPI00261F8645|nr:hypothetical protein [uncultured Brevundimonas sp.]